LKKNILLHTPFKSAMIVMLNFFLKWLKKLVKWLNYKLREVLQIHRHQLDLLAAGVKHHGVLCNLMLELRIKPAKYTQYKLLCMNKSFEFVKTHCRCNGSCEAKSGSGEPRKKKASGEQIRAIAEDKIPDLTHSLGSCDEYGSWNS
jgi:hypothetical protein